MKLDLNKISIKSNTVSKDKQSIVINDINDLSLFVKNYRKQKKVTQEELATFANTSRLAISEFENGKSDIKFSTLIKILNACSLQMEVKER